MDPSCLLDASSDQRARGRRISANHSIGFWAVLGLGVFSLAACAGQPSGITLEARSPTPNTDSISTTPSTTTTSTSTIQPIAPSSTIDPTLAGIPTARFAPTRTSEPTPIPPSEPTLQVQSDLALEGVNTYIDEDQMLHILGDIENNGDENQTVVVGAVLYDQAGRILDQVSGLTAVEVVPADGISPFEIFAARPAGYADFRVIIEGIPTDREPRTDLEILQPQDQVGARFVVTGQIHNPGSALTEYAQVLVTLYDAQDRVIAMGMELIQPEKLGAGAKTQFDIRIDEHFEPLDHYTLMAIGY